MEGRLIITICFLTCWGLQPNLLHLLADTSWRVICKVGVDRVWHLCLGQDPAGNGAKHGLGHFFNISSLCT